jgi:hypothetical protein
MKNLILSLVMFVSSFVSFSQVVELNFDVFMTFQNEDRELTGYSVLESPSIEYVNVGFGKNHITFNFDSKTITNEYYVDSDYSGEIVYTDLTNYTKSNGVVTFQAKRMDPNTKKPYTEYFVINENAMTGETNSPYFISYWFENGVMYGNVINRDLIY